MQGEYHDSFLLKNPLKAQGLDTEEVAEHIHVGLDNKEIYTSMDWVDRYMTGMDTHWDTSSIDIGRVLDTVAHGGY